MKTKFMRIINFQMLSKALKNKSRDPMVPMATASVALRVNCDAIAE